MRSKGGPILDYELGIPVAQSNVTLPILGIYRYYRLANFQSKCLQNRSVIFSVELNIAKYEI